MFRVNDTKTAYDCDLVVDTIRELILMNSLDILKFKKLLLRIENKEN